MRRSTRDRTAIASRAAYRGGSGGTKARVSRRLVECRAYFTSFGARKLAGFTVITEEIASYSIALVERLSAFFIMFIGFERVRPRLTPRTWATFPCGFLSAIVLAPSARPLVCPCLPPTKSEKGDQPGNDSPRLIDGTHGRCHTQADCNDQAGGKQREPHLAFFEP